jgi:20S proteasome alpha/beta subunit
MRLAGAQGDMERLADMISEVCDEDEREENEQAEIEQAAFDEAMADSRRGDW